MIYKPHVFFLLLLLCAVARGQAPAAQTREEPATGALSGRVVSENGQPLAGATLFVRGVNSVTSGRTTSSDAEGNFRINGLEPALYTVTAFAPAYITPQDNTLTFYRLGDSVRVELIRGGAITGLVTNGQGEPLIAIRVRAMMIRDAKGQTPKMPGFAFLEQSTDDRGIYRIFGVAPGTYLVSAGGAGAVSSYQFSPYDADVPTYAPSATRDNAAEVVVRGGEDSNADIRYRGEPGHSISGTVKVASSSGASISISPGGSVSTPIAATFQAPGNRGFAFNGLPDGDYDLVAQEASFLQTAGFPTFSLSESKRVTIKGANVTGVELLPKPLGSLSGKIVFEPSKAPECQGKRAPLLAETLVQLKPNEKDAENNGLIYTRIFAMSVSPEANGAFVIRNLLTARYQFEPRFYARYWYLKSITDATESRRGCKLDRREGR